MYFQRRVLATEKQSWSHSHMDSLSLYALQTFNCLITVKHVGRTIGDSCGKQIQVQIDPDQIAT